MHWKPWTLGLVLLLVGCGDGLVPIKTASLSGTATYNGQPLDEYRVYMYLKEGHPAQEPSTGKVGKEGQFSMGVRKEGDGAIVGLNKVWLIYDPPAPKQEPGHESSWTPPPAKIKLPKKYMSPETTDLTVEVPDGGVSDYKLEIKE